MNADLAALIAARMPDWVALRRDLHAHPELGFTEFRTASLVAKRLAELGFTVRMGRDVMDPAAMLGKPAPDQLAREMKRAVADSADASLVAAMQGGLTGVVGELKRGDGPVVAFRFDIDALPINEETSADHLPFARGFAARSS